MFSHRRTAKIVKILLLSGIVLALVQGLLVFSDLSFTSEKARRIIRDQISNVFQRDTLIEGDVRITVSLFPELLVEQIRIKNHEGFAEDDFVTLSEARVRIALPPLLSGNLYLEELTASHARINLIRTRDGSYNWSFEDLYEQTASTQAKKKKDSQGPAVRERMQIDVLKLSDVAINYIDIPQNISFTNILDKLSVDVSDKTEPRAEVIGSVDGYVYEFELEADPLEKLFSGQSWNIDGSGTIADKTTTTEVLIQIDGQGINGQIEASVDDVDLGVLLGATGISDDLKAASSVLNIKIALKGEQVQEVVKNTDIEIHLKDGYWKWQALLKDEIRTLTFSKTSLKASWNSAVQLHVDGRLFNEVVQLDLITNTLSDFVEGTDKLDIDLKAHVAASDLHLVGELDLPFKGEQFRLDLKLKGKDLERLNRILNSELPPFNDYSLSGKISANEKGYVIRADDATIGDTHFKAAIIIDTSSYKPLWSFNLVSSQLQIRDFEFAEERIEKLDAEYLREALKIDKDKQQEPGRKLKQIVDDPRMHFDLNVKAEKVLAGESVLGSAGFQIKLRDDTLVLQDAELQIPGGKIKSSASFNIQDDEVTGELKLDIDKFETGIIARYLTSDSKQGGAVSARVDLELGGPSFERIFDHASGKLDVALWPRNVSTPMFDIWANNLFFLILPEIKKQESRLNCIVALMDLEDGVMKEDFFGLDSTKVWMVGNITVDFKQEQVKLALYPRSKTARMFSVQAPIRAEGQFENIKLSTNPIDLTAAYISFITSPLHVPARWVFEDKVPEDASEKCEQFFDRDYIKELKQRVEAEEAKEIEEWLESD
ncbi:MAG: AsmA family protein [Thiotrichales bacterium]|nr:MAG: AsmA family protein [Thiotrichales bacterium]